MKPSTNLVGHTGTTRKHALKFGFKEKCPPGTVLIKRVTKEDLIKAKNQTRRLNPYYDIKYKMRQNDHFSFMSFYPKDGQVFHGASASMEVIEVDGVSGTQSSGASIMIAKNVLGGKPISVIQFGWEINYHNYGDNITRFIISWLSGGSQNTGCENMNCPGYIQLSHGTTPGTIIPQGDIELSVSLDKNTGNWFLHFVDNDNEVLGYFPKELFNNLADADNVQMGGSVNSNYEEPSPKMGTGYLPSDSRSITAAKFNRVRLANQNDMWIPPYRKIDKIYMYNDLNKTYYDIKELLDDGTEGYSFAYGGPGGWTQQPI
ncbi:hypothetical protein LUZ60_010142 [Juncus effusus]|nr:hypothetical protein LUZ60_010142 [Juncus effusus]